MKKLLAKILSLALVVVSLFSMTACKKEVFVGFDTDLAKALGQELGLTVRFVEINWDLKESLLKNNDVDLVWNGFTYTSDRDNGYYDEEREQQIGGLDFSNFYMENKQVAVVKKDQAQNYTSNASFAGKAGCSESSSAGSSVIRDFLGGTPNELPKQIDTFTAILAGTFDYAVIDSSMASVYVQASNGAYKDTLAVVDIEGVEKEYYAIGMKEDSNLVSVVNYALAKLYANGTASAIAETYGLSSVLYNGFTGVDVDTFTMPTDGDYARIAAKGEIIVGYTIFAPMNYFEIK